jgi:hypothetical protein
MLSLPVSLLQVRTLPGLPRVMTSNRARHELIQLPTILKCGCHWQGSARAWHTPTIGDRPGTVPGLARDGDAPPSPSPICPESGTLPRPRPRFGENGDGGESPRAVPDSHGVCALVCTGLVGLYPYQYRMLSLRVVGE